MFRYGEAQLEQDVSSLDDPTRLMLYALKQQSLHGPNREPRPCARRAVGERDTLLDTGESILDILGGLG